MDTVVWTVVLMAAVGLVGSVLLLIVYCYLHRWDYSASPTS